MERKEKVMKKKTILAAVMALAMAVTAGCGSRQMTAKEVLAKATETQMKMTSIDGTTKMTMTMNIEGQSVETISNMEIKAAGLTAEDLKMSTKTEMSIMGQNMTMNGYYTDGYYYMDYMGEKGKMAMDIAEMEKNLMQNNAFTEIPEDAYTTLEMTEEGDQRILTYVADGSKVTEMLDSVLGSTLGLMGDTGDMDVDLKEISGTLTVDKDFNVAAQTMKMDMSMTIEGTAVDATVNMDMTLNDPGQEVTVELPDDLDTYEEIAAEE